MIRMSHRALLLSGVALTMALGGCATTQEYDQVRAMAEDAKQSAAQAQQAAERAQATADQALNSAQQANDCCTKTNEKINRMFKKSMYK
jgi:murein lipoprotein